VARADQRFRGTRQRQRVGDGILPATANYQECNTVHAVRTRDTVLYALDELQILGGQAPVSFDQLLGLLDFSEVTGSRR